MKNILFAIKIVFFILFGFSSCSGEDKSSINTNAFGSIYNELISAHTSGVISRNTQFSKVFLHSQFHRSIKVHMLTNENSYYHK